jgi:hypothetical protein
VNKNNNLHRAKHQKNDEFYTQLVDIEKELQHYTTHFENKIVYCNCDSANSNFVKYFESNFHKLKLKGIYFSSDDFRSSENIALMQSCDIVVTNPPFSLFREFITQLESLNKKYLVVGHQNAITYKEVFPHIKNNKLWLGIGFKSNIGYFVNKHYTDYAKSSHHKDDMIRVSGVCWYTNLQHNKRNEKLILYKKYNKNDYPKYDNYNAINVNKTIDIPVDYKDLVGVPISFLHKYNADQFEVVDKLNSPVLENKKIYKRIIIKIK